MTFEPVQSLLAVGTNESKFGSGKIYVCMYLYLSDYLHLTLD